MFHHAYLYHCGYQDKKLLIKERQKIKNEKKSKSKTIINKQY